MYNGFGPGRYRVVRVAFADLLPSVDAQLVDVRVRQLGDGTDPHAAELVCTYQRDDWPEILPGDSIPDYEPPAAAAPAATEQAPAEEAPAAPEAAPESE